MHRSVAITAASLLVAFFLCVEFVGSAEAPHARGPNVREEVAIVPIDGVLAVPVSIYGRTFNFKLDTGATISKFNAPLKSLLGAARGDVVVTTPNGRRRREKRDPPPMWLGKVLLRPSGSVAVDLTNADDRMGGLIGMDFLQRLVFTVNFDEGKLRVLVAADPSLGTPVPFRRLRNVPLVAASVGGDAAEEFIVDTGGTGQGTGLLAHAVFDRLVAKGAVKNLRVCTIQDSSGAAACRGGRFASLALADHRHTDVLFMESRLSALTLSYWSRYIVTFDFPKNVMYLRPGKEFSRRDSYDLSGLTLAQSDRAVVVKAVGKGSPADRAGVMPADEVLTIDGVDADRQSLPDLRRRLHAEDTEIKLVVRRKGRELEVSLRTTTEAHVSEVNAPPPAPPRDAHAAGAPEH